MAAKDDVKRMEPDDDEDSYPRGETVPFPYANPYPQQVALMDAILQSLAEPPTATSGAAAAPSKAKKRCRVLMLESPTGTGKSLSLACASLAWLRYTERQDLLGSSSAKDNALGASVSTGVDWLDDFVPRQQRELQELRDEIGRKAQQARMELTQELEKIRGKIYDTRKRRHVLRAALVEAKQDARQIHGSSKRKRTENTPVPLQLQDGTNEFMVDTYESDGENVPPQGETLDDLDKSNLAAKSKRLSFARGALLLDGAALDGSNVYRSKATSLTSHVGPIGNVKPASGFRKIIYSARTHSQLSQFVSELRRTNWGHSVRVVALGGRKALCGNSSVLTKHKNEAAINEACLDMKKSSSSSCPLLSNSAAVDTLALHLLAKPTDIEEAADLGSTVQTCSYYASRSALAAAEVVVLPYSMLLSKESRRSIGLALEQSFVIVDEAHNLPEALRALHASRLSLPVVKSAMNQLAAYTSKYLERLAGRNLYYLGQLRRILLQIQKHLGRAQDQIWNRMMTSDELMLELRLGNVNLFKILRYLEKSRLSQKLLGFTDYRLKNAKHDAPRDDGLSKHISAMSVVQTFLEKLATGSDEGKVIVDIPSESSRVQHPTLRYVLLNPAGFFDNLLTEAYAVALVGGTLRPFVHVAAELLGKDTCSEVLREAAKADELMQSSDLVSGSVISPTFAAFSCDHVVARTNVLLQCVSRGATGKPLDFRHQPRSMSAVCDELGDSLLSLCQVVPNGVVVFLPSYSYEAFLAKHWKSTGLWEKLSSAKRIHREPKSMQNLEACMQAYATDASSDRGAVLFSVIGGKLSEGINFSNEMARCVAVVGLPYPDITDPELKEKMASMDRSSTNPITGNEYYHNLCMRAINQSVGRAIRHSKDFAAILLLDRRYQSDHRVWRGMPNWLKKGAPTDWREDTPWSHRLGLLKDFFELHNNQ